MKMKINSFQAVAEWQWDLDEAADDTCGICRTVFEGCCARCKYPGDECPIIEGECSHIFHMHCIMSWVRSESSQGRCPMCRQQFKEKSADTRKSVGGSGRARAGTGTGT